MIGEKIIESYKKDFDIVILRPGTVCGYSKSLRLDLTVNAMTFDSFTKKNNSSWRKSNTPTITYR